MRNKVSYDMKSSKLLVLSYLFYLYALKVYPGLLSQAISHDFIVILRQIKLLEAVTV